VFVVLVVAFADVAGFRYRSREGFAKEAQRFTERPWHWSLRTGLFADVALAAAVGRVWRHESWLFYILVWVCGATAVLFVNRYGLGPYLRRKYVERSPPA
jgi:hypothetical protein